MKKEQLHPVLDRPHEYNIEGFNYQQNKGNAGEFTAA